jgi:hypothetical protein
MHGATTKIITLRLENKNYMKTKSRNILVNKANLVHIFSWYIYFFSLHVSGNYVRIIRRNNCIYATHDICHSVWMTA